MKNSPGLKERLKNIGVNIVGKAKTGYKTAKNSIEQNFLNDTLRRRFNLENPYKFIIMDSMEKTSFINELLPRHAKRYNEDDIFVFYGTLSENDIKEGSVVKDLSDGTMYRVVELATVKVPVSYENQDYEVDGVAVYGKMI